MTNEQLAGRDVGEIYRVHAKQDLHDFIEAAIEAAGGRVLYASAANRAPVFFGVQIDTDERLGLLVYPFRVRRVRTKGRPEDEVRGQLRYGSEASWDREHPVGRDIAGIDVTMILGVDIEDEVFIGLDAQLWDPLPMGISFYAKNDEIEAARTSEWHVWEKINRAGTKRAEARSPSNLETVVAFAPNRILDYARLERRASSLRLDPALRFTVAESLKQGASPDASDRRHVLEEQFALTSEQILDIISDRNRLSVAVRGGVAEYHLERQLRAHPEVAVVEPLDVDAMHDFNVTMRSGELIRVECKNASPKRTAAGDFRVEVQKTRASKGDPASRFYPIDGFDAVAACLFSPTGEWTFRFRRTDDMARHREFDNRLAALHVVDDSWAAAISDLPRLPDRASAPGATEENPHPLSG